LLFSQTAEYALRTMVWLASQDGEPRTTRQIAEATRVPPGYLSKILQNLGRGGLVKAQRGIRGGFTLGRPPAEITPLDVLAVVDPVKRIDRCPLGIEGHSTGLCPLHQRLDDTLARIEADLGAVTISRLLEGSDRNEPFCSEK
jgi:Rrf2 family nitric oxide-sensitive transcriptional repressor